ncbi:MAG: adenylyl-sulfate kinase [Gemmatimonadaceae bacterium]
MSHQGAVIWFTGLPSSGKSTIARAVYEKLLGRGCSAELLDGAEVRESLSRGLGFSRADREENVRRIGYVAKLLSRNGVIALCAAVSPYRSTRLEVRHNTTNFVEVYVECPLEVAEARDVDGMYARARRGEIEEFTGITAPYEAPLEPEVHLRSDVDSVSTAVWKVIRSLELMGILTAQESGEPSPQEEEIRRRLAALGYI